LNVQSKQNKLHHRRIDQNMITWRPKEMLEMPKVGMQPIRRQQLIQATLEAVDQVGMGDASIALIARLAGVSNGIISHYFKDKNGLIAATMRHLMNALIVNVSERRMALSDNSPRAHLQVIVEGNFDASQVNGPAMKTWLAFWAASMHQPSLHRLQRINDHRLYSNLCCQFRRVLPLSQARSAARGLAALIDGLWLRGALSGDAFDTEQAQQIAYEYMDQQLAKQAS
jgi:TetR/AcrR family transcriptional repressor of bet genes